MSVGKSFVQVALDAMNKWPNVARVAGITEAEVCHGLTMLWAACYRAKVDRMPLDELLGYFPDTGKVAKALATYGFIELLGKVARVRGVVERYSKDAEQRSEAGKRGGAARKNAPRVNGRFAKRADATTPHAPTMPSAIHAGATVELTVEPPSNTTRPPHGRVVKTPDEPHDRVERVDEKTTRHQLNPRSQSLSPSERETLWNERPSLGESHAVPLEADRDSPTEHIGTPLPTPPVSPAAPPPPARNAAYDRLEAAFASLRPGKPGFARQVITAFDPPLDVLLPPDEALALALAVDDIDTEDVSGAASCVRWVRAWITHGRLPV